jgi:alpha-ketoglutarate-dependent taurine dioxygenase
MLDLPLEWMPQELRASATEWALDLRTMLASDFGLVAELDRWLPATDERWRHYEDVPWPRQLDALSDRLESLIRRKTGIAVLSCRFGENVTRTASGDGRPLFAVTARPDATAEGKYVGNALKSNQIGFHTDGSGSKDREVRLLSMLCVRPARFGGQSRVASSRTAYALLSSEARSILSSSFPRQDPYDPKCNAASLKTVPVFALRPPEQQGLCFSYHPARIRNGVRSVSGEVPPDKEKAFAALDAALDAASCEINLHANDILFLNNDVIAHDRRPFWDDPSVPRWLERFWAGALLAGS